MTITRDNQLQQQGSGAADWDSGLNDTFGILERGYHTTAQAGVAVHTGDIVWMTSGGFFVPFDPNSTAIFPDAIAPFAVGSGESQLFLLNGIVRSLSVGYEPGIEYFVSALTPGLVVSTPNGNPIGHGLSEGGLYFRPRIAVQSIAGILPTGGNSGDVLIKTSSTNYAAGWTDPNSLPGGGAAAGGSHRWWGLFNIIATSAGVTNGNPCIAQVDLMATSGGAPVTVTSAFASSWVAAGNDPTHGIDNASGYWNALNTAPQHFWIDVGSGQSTALSQVAITTRSDTFFWQGVYNFNLMYSDNGTKWTLLCHVQGVPFTSANQKQTWNVD